jgi:spermidine/putrescine transport system substrate-binding protein/spermidine/putrescine transport system permease protein
VEGGAVARTEKRAAGSRAWSPLGLVTLAVYAFLYAPLLVLVAFSFNRGRLTAQWEGFTLAWYGRLLENAQILGSLRNSLVVGFAATAASTVFGTLAAVAFHRHRFRRQPAWDALVTLPIVVPEIVLASSLVLLFSVAHLRLGFLSVILAHVVFSISYAVVVVKARLAGFDRSLEEAAMDLGAGPWQTFFKVTLPGIAPGVLAAALLVFALSIDDYVITSFVAGVGSTTLPVQIYSMVKSGITPEINAVSTLLLAATSLLLFAAYRLEQGKSVKKAAAPVALGLVVLALPFVLGRRGGGEGERVLNLYIWSNYIAPETVQKFEKRYGVRVNVDLYDTNEALLAKIQAGNVGYDVLCPSNYPIEILLKQGALKPLDHSALPHLSNLDPRFLDRDYDRGNRYSVPYFWGTCGIGYRRQKAGAVSSWATLWDPRFRNRVLMLDDARETLGAALKWKGHSVNTTDPAVLAEAQRLLIEQKPLVKTYDSANYHDVLLSGDVWVAQGWNGQFAKVMDHEADIGYVIPEEGSSFFIDSLVIPAAAPHPELAHRFIDFTLEAEIAAEICRTMRYSSPNRAAHALLPPEIRTNPAIFPPEDVISRLELIHDLGEATVLYDRLWTEVKTR